MDSAAAVAEAYERLGADAEPGEFARAIRTALGLSLKAVAEKLGHGTHFTTVSKLEKGKMTFTYEWAKLFAQALDVSASVFHMPYESAHMPKRVPVYTSLSDVINPSSAPDHYTSYMGLSDSVFGYTFLGYPDIVSELVYYTAIVDNARAHPAPNRVYLIEHDDHSEPIIGIYRNDSNLDRIVPWPKPVDGMFWLSEGKIKFLGEVLELQRMLVSRNS